MVLWRKKKLWCLVVRLYDASVNSFATVLLLYKVTVSCLDPGFIPIASILHEVQLMSGGIFTRYKASTLFDIKVGASQQ